MRVDDSFVPDTSSRYNPAGVLKNGVARTVIRGMYAALPVLKHLFPSSSVRIRDNWDYKVRQLVNSRILTAVAPPSNPDLREELIEGYSEDIAKLHGLNGRELSVWFE